jgi:hypothetical protein
MEYLGHDDKERDMTDYDDNDPTNVKVIGRDVPYDPVDPVWEERPYTILDDLTPEQQEEILGRSIPNRPKPTIRNDEDYATLTDPRASSRRDDEDIRDQPTLLARRPDTPADVRRESMSKAVTLATTALGALEGSIEWFAIDDPDTAAEYRPLTDEIASYRERLTARLRKQQETWG